MKLSTYLIGRILTVLSVCHICMCNTRSGDERSVLPEYEMREIISGENRKRDARAFEQKRLTGRNSVSSNGAISRLPDESLFGKRRPLALKCGSAYDVAQEGLITFKLTSKGKLCYHAFLGSRKEKCRVAILCEGTLTFDFPTSPNGGCVKEYIKISDASSGLMIECGNYSFKNIPRKSRNGGNDLYLLYNGASPNECVVFCLEDINAVHGVKPAEEISKNPLFTGFKPEECTCGKRMDMSRVVGGEEAKKFEFPWIAAIVFKGPPSYARQPFCGGTLINDRYLVTAAHCFVPDQLTNNDIQVVLHAHLMDKRFGKTAPSDPSYLQIPGWNMTDETDESEASVRLDVQEIRNHPLFSLRTFDWDVALVKLKPRLNLTQVNVKPVCLPEIGDRSEYNKGDMFTVAGWGRHSEGAPAGSRILNKLDVPYAPHEECAKITIPSSRHICAGYTEGNKDACSGDSGGPLIHKFNSNNQFSLAGVVSAGEGCARTNKLGLYTNVKDIVQWIYHHTADARWCGV